MTENTDGGNNRPVLVCAPVASLPYPGKGSIAVACVECGQPVWLVPDYVLARDITPDDCDKMCMGCFLEIVGDIKDPEFPPASDAQIAAMAEDLGISTEEARAWCGTVHDRITAMVEMNQARSDFDRSIDGIGDFNKSEKK